MSLLPALAAASPMMQTGTMHQGAAPIMSTTNAKEVPNSYMVVFKKHVKESHAKEHHEWVQSIHSKSESERMELRKRSQFPITTDVFDGLKHTYNIIGGMVGYSGHFDDETIEAIRRHPDVSCTRFHFLRRFVSCVRVASLAVLRHPSSPSPQRPPWRPYLRRQLRDTQSVAITRDA